MKKVSPTNGSVGAAAEGDPKKSINGELWQACAGPLVNLPAAGTHVVYFPQGHSEQVAASMKKDIDAQVPNYPNLPSKLLCVLHSIILNADPDTDEVYAQMTLQPVPSFDKDVLLRSDLSMRSNKPQMDFFCKTLTASDTSTHGGFSVPRRAAEKIFPPLDFTLQPPAQELVARDLHDNVWTFRHIYRGQPKRHLLTTGWSHFVSGKRLIAGDSVLFIRDEKHQLLLGIRRANRQPTALSSSVLSSDSMHIGILAAAAHAASNNSPFTVYYNPRASPSEFVIPLAKYYKAVCSNQISLGMRFRMMFETEESGTRRYMGTITGISDLDPVRWKNSQWRNLQVGWDESTTGEKRNRVSIWEIEPVTAPFFICQTPPLFHPKRSRQLGMPDDDPSDLDVMFRSKMPFFGDDFGFKDPQSLSGFSLAQWMNMQQNSNYVSPLPGSVLQNTTGSDITRRLGLPVTQVSQNNGIQNNCPRLNQQPVQDHLQKLPSSSVNNLPVGPSIVSSQQQLVETTQNPRHIPTLSSSFPVGQVTAPISQSQVQNMMLQQQQQLQRNLPQNLHLQQQQQISSQNFVAASSSSSQPVDILSQQLHISDQLQFQLLQKLEQQQNSLLAQQQSGVLSQFVDIPQSFSRSITSNPMVDASQGSIGMARSNSQSSIRNGQHQQLLSGILSEPHGHVGSSLNLVSNQLSANAGGGPSAVTEDVPSCSTSPSTNNCSNAASFVMLQEPLSDMKPSLNISRSQNHGFYNPIGGSSGQVDYLDSSSSATSVLSQNNNSNMCFNSQSIVFRDAASQEIEAHGDPRNNGVFGSSFENQLGMPVISDTSMTRNTSGGGGMMNTYDNNNTKENQPDFSSSVVSQSFGVPDMAFNSIDMTMNEGTSFMNKGGSWGGAPQVGRMRTYTKVYKRGAVGRSIDITRYSGYDELKQNLARRFGVEGQLEDRQRIGWKLVYVDHENDVLLVGDDPWEEFVNCVRCIKILSPQEVQQMSLDGDFGNSVIPNQACSSSDNGAS